MSEDNISYVNSLRHCSKNPPHVAAPMELYNILKKSYDASNKHGLTVFEYFNADSQMIKPHVDYEQYIDADEYTYVIEIDLRDKVLKALSLLFDDTNWAIACDTRAVLYDGKQCQKISYHFVLCNVKTTMANIRVFMTQNIHIFANNGMPGLDLKVYRNGINKWRVPMAKKAARDPLSLMCPINNTEPDEYHNHMVSCTKNCKTIKYEVTPPTKIILASPPPVHNYNVIDQYTVISTKTVDNTVFYDIRENLCGIIHTNNHNFLVSCPVTGTIKAKCHSERCTDFEHILYKVPSPTFNFDVDHFNNIPICKGKTDNYAECKRYFELFFIRLLDSNTFKRKNYTHKDQEPSMDLVQIVTRDYANVLYSQGINIDKDGNENIVCKQFFSDYTIDKYAQKYLNTLFHPIGIKSCDNSPKGSFNTFMGFGYMDRQDPRNIYEYKDLLFLINHIKYNICGFAVKQSDELKDLARHQWTYLVMYIKNILENPQKVPPIMLVFYSPEHGTGKSMFTKFISRIIGTRYCQFLSLEQLQEKHCTSHVNKLLNVIEEVDRNATYKAKNYLKDVVQRNDATVNEKNIPIYQTNTYVRYIATTNFCDGMYMDCNSRRFVVYTFRKLHNIQYVAKLDRIMNNPFIVRAFAEYIVDEFDNEIDGISDWIRKRPLTADYYEMRNGDCIQQFLLALITKDEAISYYPPYYWTAQQPDRITIPKCDMYNTYKQYSSENIGNYKKLGKNKFFKVLNSNWSTWCYPIISRTAFNRRPCYEIDIYKLAHIIEPHKLYASPFCK
jgi:hypothetical protein